MQSEWVLAVHGLGVMDSGNGGSGALRLFGERATQVEPTFSLDDQRAEVTSASKSRRLRCLLLRSATNNSLPRTASRRAQRSRPS